MSDKKLLEGAGICFITVKVLVFRFFEYNVKVIDLEILGPSREEANELKLHLGRFPFRSPESISKVITHRVITLII